MYFAVLEWFLLDGNSKRKTLLSVSLLQNEKLFAFEMQRKCNDELNSAGIITPPAGVLKDCIANPLLISF